MKVSVNVYCTKKIKQKLPAASSPACVLLVNKYHMIARSVQRKIIYIRYEYVPPQNTKKSAENNQN